MKSKRIARMFDHYFTMFDKGTPKDQPTPPQALTAAAVLVLAEVMLGGRDKPDSDAAGVVRR